MIKRKAELAEIQFLSSAIQISLFFKEMNEIEPSFAFILCFKYKLS